MRDDYTRQMILETLVADLQSQVAKLTCENKELYRTNKILLAQIQDLQYDQVNHDELVEDLEDEIANLKVDVADLEIEKKDLEDENGELQEKVYDLERDIDNLKDDKSEMAREIRLLKEELDEIKGK